jgi:hypothetical protein
MAKLSDMWSESQINKLKELYVGSSWEDLEREFGRGRDTIRAKANRLGLDRGLVKVWSADEENELRSCFTSLPIKEQVEKFGRSWVAISGKAHSLGLSRSERWTDEELDILAKNYGTKSFDELELMLGRTARAMKHAISTYGLKVYKRRKWGEDEISLIAENLDMTGAELVSGIGDRSACAIDQRKRSMLGSSKRVIRVGWDTQSKELSYLLGCICSDVYVNSAGMVLAIHPKDVVFGDEFARCAKIVFGLEPKRAIRSGSWEYKDEKFYGEYYVVGVYSIDLLPLFATKEGIANGNVRGYSGEWVDFLNEKFSWVFDDVWFGYFLGGLYDGDGSLSNGCARIAVKPQRSKDRIMCELERRGISVRYDGASICMRGSEESKRFLDLTKSILRRKRLEEMKEERPGVDGVTKIGRYDALKFFEKYHYLKTLSGGCELYGFVKDNKLIGVAAFGKCEDVAGEIGYELQRFALVDWTDEYSSRVLSEFLSRFKQEHEGLGFIKTFADQGQNHVGTIYQATNALYLGQSGLQQVFVGKNGVEYGGRFSDRRMEKDGVLRGECSVRLVPGKHKYVYAVSKAAKVYFGNFALAYPKLLLSRQV